MPTNSWLYAKYFKTCSWSNNTNPILNPQFSIRFHFRTWSRVPRDYKHILYILDKTDYRKMWISLFTLKCLEPRPSHPACTLCPEKGGFVGPQNSGWLGHWHHPGGCASRPCQARNSILSSSSFFFFLHTRVNRFSAPSRPPSVPHRSADGKKPTHIYVSFTG